MIAAEDQSLKWSFSLKDRRVIQPAIPCLTGKHGNTELNRVDQDYSCPPGINSRQLHGGP